MTQLICSSGAYTYMQFELFAVVRLARARVAASFTLPLSELIILIKGAKPSEKEEITFMKVF